MESAARAFATLGLLVACAGCAVLPGRTPVHSKVTAFHVLPAETAGTTYAFAACRGQADDVDYPAYQAYVRDELRARRWVETSPASATLLIAFAYAIAADRTPPLRVPVFARSAWNGASTSASASAPAPAPAPASAFAPAPATDCVLSDPIAPMPRRDSSAFWRSRVRLDGDHARVLTIVMADRSSLRSPEPGVAYVATVVSVGSSGTLRPVMPALVKAAFADFPGASGATRKDVRLP